MQYGLVFAIIIKYEGRILDIKDHLLLIGNTVVDRDLATTGFLSRYLFLNIICPTTNNRNSFDLYFSGISFMMPIYFKIGF